MFVPNREELAWAAGFFDGEGTIINVIRKNGSSITLSVTQAGPFAEPLLHRFNAAIGDLGNVLPGTKVYPNRQPTWSLKISNFEGVQAAIAMLWPFLGPAKRAQAKNTLAQAKVYFASISEQGRNCYRRRVENRAA